MDKIIKIGRRKTSVARVFANVAEKPGQGKMTINGREFEDYFPVDFVRIKVLEPFSTLEQSYTDYDFFINVNGGGITGQAEAVRMAFARYLVDINPENRLALKKKGLLTRDSRMVERKKYGQPGARKKFQFSKR